MTFNVPLNTPAPTTQCAFDPTLTVVKDNAHILAVGFSHYHKDENGNVTKSYAQIHSTMYCATRQNAVSAAHARIDQHTSIPFGEHNKSVLNPNDEFADAIVKMAIEYHSSPMAWSSLPQVDAITGARVTNDVYVPHVDDSSRGMCYQDILLTSRGINADLNTATLGTTTLENAQKLAHRIVDEVIQASYEGKKV